MFISVSRVARFCFAIIQVFRKFQFANDIFETILSKFASIAFLLYLFEGTTFSPEVGVGIVISLSATVLLLFKSR